MGQATALACLVSGVLSGPLKDGDPLGDEFLLLYEADSRVLPGGGLVVPLQSQSRLYRLSVRAPYAEPIRMMNIQCRDGWLMCTVKWVLIPMKILTMPLCSDLINVLTSLRDEQGRQPNVAILTLEDSEFRLLELFYLLVDDEE